MKNETKNAIETITTNLFCIKDAIDQIFATVDDILKEKESEKKAPAKQKCFYMEKRRTPFKPGHGSFEITFKSIANPKLPKIVEKFDNMKDMYARIPGLGKYVCGGSPERHVNKLNRYFKDSSAPVRVVGFRRIKKGGKK